ncbi:STY4528 family pathogenicity island replication protein, partial [Escherichia coli]
VMKRAREGNFNSPDMSRSGTIQFQAARPSSLSGHGCDERERRRREVASPEKARNIVAEFRASIQRANAARLAMRG